jgi:adenine phosphoribosyltransferase
MQLVEKLKHTIRDVPDFPKPGILFKDITPVFQNPMLFGEVVDTLVTQFKSEKFDVIAAVEARGFIMGSILAHELGCAFVPIRKAGKLPYHTRSEEYSLEYGMAKIEMHNDAIRPGSKVLIHDDLLATGGTAAAAGKLIQNAGGQLGGFSFLINLSFLPGEQNLQAVFGVKPYYLISY